jgi:hypothetical protein
MKDTTEKLPLQLIYDIIWHYLDGGDCIAEMELYPEAGKLLAQLAKHPDVKPRPLDGVEQELVLNGQ